MMTPWQALTGSLANAALAAPTTGSDGQDLKRRALPPPRTSGGRPVMEALALRRSTHEYLDRPLPPQMLSDLLWAAFGKNRSNGGWTAPYARDILAIDIYAAMADSVWLYEPTTHTLLPHMKDDIRAETGLQDFVAKAPVNLVYVAHGERLAELGAEEARLAASVDAGMIGQNVYLFCASEGLATVFRGAVDQQKLAQTMRLADEQFVTFAQTVGYPRA